MRPKYQDIYHNAKNTDYIITRVTEDIWRVTSLLLL